MTWIERCIVGAIVAVLALIGWAAWREIAHPCTHKVNCRPHTVYVVTGNVANPITTEVCDCLERAR